MTLLFILAYLGGALTIVSPCILPVLPFVFARAGQPFIRSGLPLLLGMAITFAAVATLAAVGGGWAVQANTYGRWAALALMSVFGLTLLFPSLSDRLTRPLVALGSRLSNTADKATREGGGSIVPSFLLGIATGLLWAPCAGPILGILLTGAALNGASVSTTFLLLAYAGGAATSLGLALLIGGRVFATMKKSLGAGEWVRRGLGIAVLAGVLAIAAGLDTGLLARLSLGSTSRIEAALIKNADMPNEAMPIKGEMPSIDGAVTWLNSPPLTKEALRGKVVVIDFWTYSCINCIRSIPYVRAWADKYRDQGLVVIGVHTPEFAFEKDVGNVKKAIADMGITYPVAVDNNFANWRAFKNQYWPAHYFIDAKGQIRGHHFGEGSYDKSERMIQMLLAEAGRGGVPAGIVKVDGNGAEAAADIANRQSPETYVGYDRAENFVSAGGFAKDTSKAYAIPAALTRNQWALQGQWTVEKQRAVPAGAGARIAFRFRARDLHLVMGSTTAKPVRFRVTIDGKAPGADHGVDIDANGIGTINSERLYQLIRQNAVTADRTFEIEFLDPGAAAFAFTFG